MATVVLDAYSKAYPAIANRIRAAVFNENDLLAPVATIIDVTAGHPQRIWHFPGLPRANYAFSLDEIDGGGVPINNLAFFDVVPGQVDGLLTRKDEQIVVGTTTGFNTGASVAVFDGTGGKPNYIGWTIVPSELTGRGILDKIRDYTWDSSTGTFTLIQAGDTLQVDTTYNIHFDPQQGSVPDSVPTIIDFTSRLVTATGNINVTDFGNTIVLEPAGEYIELTLPDILTVPQGRPVRIDATKVLGVAGLSCTKIKKTGADVINFLRGNIFVMNGESLQIYRFRRPDLSNEWRVFFPCGNFARAGENVGEEAIQTGVYGKKLKDGSSESILRYARIYNDYVLTLPGTQVCDYDDHATGNNKYLFSKANSADPDNAGKFLFPDWRGLFERNNNAGKSGDFVAESIKLLDATVSGVKKNSDSGGGNTTIGAAASPLDATPGEMNVLSVFPIVTPGATETAPTHVFINKYVIV